jgi:hypothetical protein
MADPFLQNTWYWWETNDEYIASWQWQVQEAVCVDINSSSKYFMKNDWYLPYNILEYVWQDPIRQFITSNYVNRLIFFTYWKIYNLTWLVVDTAKNIVNAGVYNNTGFIIFSNGSIDIWTYDANALDLWMSTRVANKLTWLTVNYYFAPFYLYANNLLLATWSNIYRINLTTWTLTTTSTVLIWWQIRWITKIWDQFNIYVNYWGSSKQYIWNWLDDLPSNEINWYDRVILNVANINNVDYVVCQDGLYLANWLQPQILYKRTFISEYTNAIETYKNKIYIPWYKAIYSYQVTKPWFPYNLSKELVLPITDWQGVSCMTSLPNTWESALWEYVSDLMILYTNYYIRSAYYSYWVQYAIRDTSSPRSPIWWFVTLNPIPSLYSQDKSSKKIRLWYNLCDRWETNRAYIYAWVTKTFYFRHNIWIFAYRDFTPVVSIYIWWVTVKPEIWSIYTINWYNLTVKENEYLFSSSSTYNWWITLEWDTNTKMIYLEKTINSMTKVSWTWDTSIMYLSLHEWEVINLITDYSKHEQIIMVTWNFNQIKFTIHITEWTLQTNSDYENKRIQTKVFDFAFLYDDIINQLK